jgi:UDP-2,3-diacylglucosamine pyrophosphatase LpxH
MLDAVIVSDFHLGTENCQAKFITGLLKRIESGEILTRQLILNGDVFQSLDFRRLRKKHWKVLSLLRKLSDDMEIIWIAGNHDGSADIISHLLGVDVCEEYVLESGPEKILIFHGHQYDRFIDDHPILTWLADCVYAFLQWIDKSHYLAKVAKHGSKTFLRCAKKIENGAVARARDRGCTIVTCGHTHAALANIDQPIPYYNSGCWTELPCTYLTVKGGNVQLRTYEHADDMLETIIDEEIEVAVVVE